MNLLNFISIIMPECLFMRNFALNLSDHNKEWFSFEVCKLLHINFPKSTTI